MFKRLLSLFLVALLINLAGVAPAYAASKAEKEARHAEKVKAGVLKFGTGESARVKIKLRDKTKLEGYISAADGEGFTVVDAKTGMATVGRLSTGQKRPGAQSLEGHKDRHRCWHCCRPHFYYPLVHNWPRQ